MLSDALVFFPVYHLCNWYSDQRLSVYHLYWRAELKIPFVQELFWAYISVYVLILLPPFLLKSSQLAKLGKQILSAILIAGGLFLLFPSQLGFTRNLPSDPLYAKLYGLMFSADLPHNMFPSLHIALSALLLLSFSEAQKSTFCNALWAVWFTLIAISTLFVHQHHVLDIIAGICLAGIVRRITHSTNNS